MCPHIRADEVAFVPAHQRADEAMATATHAMREPIMLMVFPSPRENMPIQ